MSVGSLDSSVVGSCLLCGFPYDDYSSRNRCKYCRMLVLVCDSCQKTSGSYACELCQKNRKIVESVLVSEGEPLEVSEGEEYGSSSSSHMATPQLIVHGSRVSRKLRILCLHGFRQNASGFKGRLGSLAKKLKSCAELVFVDAPHELPFIYMPRVFSENQVAVPTSLQPNPYKTCNKKFAWLVGPGYQRNNIDNVWSSIDAPFDSLQYQQQKEGFDASLAYLKTIFSKCGPFDGVLGFSQGAAMAALLCSQHTKLRGAIDFRFVILCSGFAVNMEDWMPGSINFPSLHIFGNHPGKDRQIDRETSRHLASIFEEGCSVVIEHELGHIIPTQSPHIDKMKCFLQRFV